MYVNRTQIWPQIPLLMFSQLRWELSLGDDIMHGVTEKVPYNEIITEVPHVLLDAGCALQHLC